MMSTIVQLKRNLGNTPVAAPTLLDGELAYARSGFLPNGGANELMIGDGAGGALLISNQRQLELDGNQSVKSGTKTWEAGAKIAIQVNDLFVTGGLSGEVLTTDGTGNLTWAAPSASLSADGTTIVDNGGVLSVSLAGIADGITIKDVSGKLAVNTAVTADVAAGTANKFLDTAVLKTDVLGAGLSALATTAKTVVPAINELRTEIAALTGVMIFAGTLDASTGDITAASGVPNVPANISAVDPALTKNYVWIVTVAGSNVGTGNTKPAAKQDWVASDGTKLVTLNYGLQAVVAANVEYTPGTNVYAVSNNVQAAIDELDVALRGPIDGGVF